MHLRSQRIWTVALLTGLVTIGVSNRCQSAEVGPSAKEIKTLVDQAVSFLKKSQKEDGSFSPQYGGPGITALVTAALLRQGYTANDPTVAKALAYLEKSAKSNGGIYDKALANYTTSVALIALKEANRNGKYDKIIANASKFLKGLQNGGAGESLDDPAFGGVSYDGKRKPDLSNTAYFMEALKAAGVPPDDPAMKQALMFISRCQNLPGEHNKLPFAKKTTDDDKGGLTYRPFPGSEKDPYRTVQGGLRSSGVMTYAGLKSFLYAGVSKNDARVKAAVDWIRRHYRLDQNPGLGTAGLFYYYHTFGKAMSVLGDDYLVDAAQKKHDWRKDLFEAIKQRQGKDGSWTNANGAFLENNPDLATAYALLALSYCKAK